jgi:transmembrane sensor
LLTDEEIDRLLAWREGRLEFNGQTLLTAVTEMSRYSNVRFVLADPGIERAPFTIRIRIGELDRFLSALENGYLMLRVQRRGDVIYVSRKP